MKRACVNVTGNNMRKEDGDEGIHVWKHLGKQRKGPRTNEEEQSLIRKDTYNLHRNWPARLAYPALLRNAESRRKSS